MGGEELDISSEAKENRTRRIAQPNCLKRTAAASTEKVTNSKPPAVIGPQLKRRLGLPFAGVTPTVTATASDAMPLAITSSKAGPMPMEAGTSKLVATTALPVATAMVWWSCVRQNQTNPASGRRRRTKG